MDNFKALAPVLGDEKTKELLKLTNKYDKYIGKFKTDVNAILGPLGFEILTGVAFRKKEKKTTSKK